MNEGLDTEENKEVDRCKIKICQQHRSKYFLSKISVTFNPSWTSKSIYTYVKIITSQSK